MIEVPILISGAYTARDATAFWNHQLRFIVSADTDCRTAIMGRLGRMPRSPDDIRGAIEEVNKVLVGQAAQQCLDYLDGDRHNTAICDEDDRALLDQAKLLLVHPYKLEGVLDVIKNLEAQQASSALSVA